MPGGLFGFGILNFGEPEQPPTRVHHPAFAADAHPTASQIRIARPQGPRAPTSEDLEGDYDSSVSVTMGTVPPDAEDLNAVGAEGGDGYQVG
jgi:hypothetical protein